MSNIKNYMNKRDDVALDKEQELLDKMVLLEGVWVRDEQTAEENIKNSNHLRYPNYDKDGNYRISSRDTYRERRPSDLEALKQTYSYNNGKITVMSSDGKLYGAPATEEIMNLLKESGYKEGILKNISLGVELSNGEKIVNKEGQEEVFKRWNALDEQQQKEIEERQKQREAAEQEKGM
ncbi:MAG: hypothetical protein LBM01_01620 [Christensenellaceae bacterium]|jgi:hypothetical protein|nr:hypothetical protein [Christensenellaceae bacterium]